MQTNTTTGSGRASSSGGKASRSAGSSSGHAGISTQSRASTRGFRFEIVGGRTDDVLIHLGKELRDPRSLIGLGFTADGSEIRAVILDGSFPARPGMYVDNSVDVLVNEVATHLEGRPCHLVQASQMHGGLRLATLRGPGAEHAAQTFLNSAFFTLSREAGASETVAGIIGAGERPHVLSFCTNAKGEDVTRASQWIGGKEKYQGALSPGRRLICVSPDLTVEIDADGAARSATVGHIAQALQQPTRPPPYRQLAPYDLRTEVRNVSLGFVPEKRSGELRAVITTKDGLVGVIFADGNHREPAKLVKLLTAAEAKGTPLQHVDIIAASPRCLTVRPFDGRCLRMLNPAGLPTVVEFLNPEAPPKAKKK